jgi:hypothetical protein
LRDLRNKWFVKGKLHLACELPRVEAPEVRMALGIYDQVVLRFDWGTAKTFTAMTGRKSADFANLCAHLGHLENLVFQTRFVRGEVDNSTDAEVKAWVKKVGELKPREIHLVGAESKAKKLKPAPKTRIAEIAADVTEKTGVPTRVINAETLLG